MQNPEISHLAAREWMTVIGFALLGLMAAVTLSFSSDETYESHTQLFVSSDVENAADAYAFSIFAGQRTKSYAALVGSENLAARAIKKHDLGLTPQEVSAKVSAEVLPDTAVIDITATDTDPKKAQRLAGAIAAELPAYVHALESADRKGKSTFRLSVTSPASLADRATTPRWSLNIGLGLVIGVLFGVAVAVLRQRATASV
ncbi:YveK family protein [Nocardioides sp. NPDC057772]|uniref:YveK family protein n=1 Tax=Nocardioides sp. NPDC057772 TaxID=3346245 RepID=UPI00366E84E2